MIIIAGAGTVCYITLFVIYSINIYTNVLKYTSMTIIISLDIRWLVLHFSILYRNKNIPL